MYLWDNQLSGEIPATLASRSSLKELWLNRNALSGTLLRYRLCRLARFPSESGIVPLNALIPNLSSLTNLTRLYLDHNQLSGRSLPGWATLPRLQT